jgi:hypothetical protein
MADNTSLQKVDSMEPERVTRRALTEGVAHGLIAGAGFLVVQIILALATGNPALMPLRYAASVLVGIPALSQTSLGVAVVLGLIVHFALSALYGLIYGAFESRMSLEGRASVARQTGLGALYGLIIWFFNFQFIARLFYPWFLGAPQFLQLVLHAVTFGLPLGLFFTVAERRARQRASSRTPVGV